MCPTGSPDSCDWQTIVKTFRALLKFLWFVFHFTLRAHGINPPERYSSTKFPFTLMKPILCHGVCVCHPTPTVMDLLCSKVNSFWHKDPPTHMLNWAAPTTATGLSQRSNVPSGQSRCFPDLWPQTLLWLWDSIFFCPLCPHPPRGQIYHLPLWGWLYCATQEQPQCAQKMPLLCKIWHKGTKYSHHTWTSDFILLPFKHEHLSS